MDYQPIIRNFCTQYKSIKACFDGSKKKRQHLKLLNQKENEIMDKYKALEALLNNTSLSAPEYYSQLFQSVEHLDTNMPILLDLGDNYNGSTQFPPLNLFVAAILSSLGYTCLLHGSRASAVAGAVTTHQILKRAGKSTSLTLEEVLDRLQDHDIAWAYLDQEVYSPELAKWRSKYAFQTPAERLFRVENKLQPIRAHKNYLVSTCSNLPDAISLLDANYEAEAMLCVTERHDTTLLAPSENTACKLIKGGVSKSLNVEGKHFGFKQTVPNINRLTPEEGLYLGLLVLDAEENPMRKLIQYQCVVILHHLFGEPIEDAMYDVRQAIDTGAAMMHWNSYQ